MSKEFLVISYHKRNEEISTYIILANNPIAVLKKECGLNIMERIEEWNTEGTEFNDYDCFYHNEKDERIYLATPGGMVVEIGPVSSIPRQTLSDIS